MATPKSTAIYSGEAQSALDKLVQALDERKNRQLFDPTLLAMAEGFLSPTRSGGFGESLGLAAGKVRTAQEAEDKQAMEEARTRFELAQLKGQLQTQKAQWADILGETPAGAPSAPAGAPSAPAAPGAAPTAAPGAAAPSAAPTQIPGGMSRVNF